MKSAHRHQLETNALAHRLEGYIERYRPYAATILGAIAAVLVLILIWSYFSGSSAAKRSEAWDTFNHAIGSNPPNLERIHSTAQDFPNTPVQEMADVTWADAQVYLASRNYLGNREAAKGMLEAATSVYLGVVQSSDDERLSGRARLGLARIYEMQNQLDKARAEYSQVTGTYAKYAQQQAERLKKPDAQEAYSWLATAQLPRPQMPAGPGTPGQRPEFSAGEMALPGASSDAGKTEGTKGAEDIKNLLDRMRAISKQSDTPDRYKADQKGANDSATAPPSKDAPPSEPKSPPSPPDAAASETKPAENPPAADKSAK